MVDFSSLGTFDCNVTAVRKASRRLTQLYDDALAPTGLRSTQYAILAELNARPGDPPTMRELADLLVLDRSALGHSLRPLLRDGLLELAEAPGDRRSRHVVLTERGRQLFRRAYGMWRQAQSRYAEVIGQAEGDDLRERLLRIAHDERLETLTDGDVPRTGTPEDLKENRS